MKTGFLMTWLIYVVINEKKIVSILYKMHVIGAHYN